MDVPKIVASGSAAACFARPVSDEAMHIVPGNKNNANNTKKILPATARNFKDTIYSPHVKIISVIMCDYIYLSMLLSGASWFHCRTNDTKNYPMDYNSLEALPQLFAHSTVRRIAVRISCTGL
jgi:hypothetical protein